MKTPQCTFYFKNHSEYREYYIKNKYIEKTFTQDGDHSKLQEEVIQKLIKGEKKETQSMVEYNGMLKIKLNNAKNLPSKDLNGLSDPYFIFNIGKQTLKSKSIHFFIHY
jgi:Ca2+-dependent lipid-binding protein